MAIPPGQDGGLHTIVIYDKRADFAAKARETLEGTVRNP
jgi:hypothetical protein